MSHPVYYCEEHNVIMHGEALAWRHKNHKGYRKIGICASFIRNEKANMFHANYMDKIHEPTHDEMRLLR